MSEILRCSVDGCDDVHSARGYCGKHYQHLRRRGLIPAQPKPTEEERFWSKVDKTGDCWLWTGVKGSAGYGQFQVKVDRGRFRTIGAHRYAYELCVGPIPEGLHIDHRCRTKSCVNPDHLRPVTPKQNAENLGDDRANNTSGVRGVHWDKRRQKWRASVQFRIDLGHFASLEDAAAAVRAKRNELHTHNDVDRQEAS